MGKGMSPIRGYNYKNWNANFNDIVWAETKTIDNWVECLGLENAIADWDFTLPRDEKITLEVFLSQLTYCTLKDIEYCLKLGEYFDKDKEFVTCAECGQPRKWTELKNMAFKDGEFVCKNCNFN